jgi:hypothetical protein
MLPSPVIKKVVKGLRPDKRVKLEEGEAMPEEKELTYEDWMAALQSEAAGTDTPEGDFVWDAWMLDPKGEQAANREAASRAGQETWEKDAIEKSNERYREWMMGRTPTEERIRRSRWTQRQGRK